jgi:RNA polymerase sigma factor (sigma-70 family)
LEREQILDTTAFSQLYDCYFSRIYNYVSYKVGNKQEAEDYTAQIFERVLTKYHTFEAKKGSFDNWIFSIAHNMLANHWRSLRRHPKTSLEETQEKLEIFPADDYFAPSESFLRREELERLTLYLKRLNRREHDLIALRFGAGLSQHKIGTVLGMQEANVAVALGRVIKKLRHWFEQDE